MQGRCRSFRRPAAGGFVPTSRWFRSFPIRWPSTYSGWSSSQSVDRRSADSWYIPISRVQISVSTVQSHRTISFSCTKDLRKNGQSRVIQGNTRHWRHSTHRKVPAESDTVERVGLEFVRNFTFTYFFQDRCVHRRSIVHDLSRALACHHPVQVLQRPVRSLYRRLAFFCYCKCWQFLNEKKPVFKIKKKIEYSSLADMSFCLLATLIISVLVHHTLESFFIASSTTGTSFNAQDRIAIMTLIWISEYLLSSLSEREKKVKLMSKLKKI